MGRELSLFSDYHQKENSLTNYCGLILKLLYQENPMGFEEAINSLLPSDTEISVGPAFSQQKKEEKSIPDLSIIQQPFSIFVETKINDWFYSDQIKRHIAGLAGNTGLKVLFLLSNFEHNDFEKRFKDDYEHAKKEKITLVPLTFEDFIGTLENIRSSSVFEQYFEEFKSYIDRGNYLPTWKYLLDVVNCTGTKHEIDAGAYMCCDKGGAYSHRRAKYFGPYAQKQVSDIFEIDAVVSVDINQTEAYIRWQNVSESNESLKKKAIEQIKKWDYRIEENKHTPVLVFLLSNKVPTNFRKSTSGGMQQSKKYFWNIANDCSNSIELAAKLKDKTWENIR